jgi:hypothetical protein
MIAPIARSGNGSSRAGRERLSQHEISRLLKMKSQRLSAWMAVRQTLERFPFERHRSNDRKSLKIKMLEQALIEKVHQLF